MTSVGPFGKVLERFLTEFDPLVAEARAALGRLEALHLGAGQECLMHVERAVREVGELRQALAAEVERSAVPAVDWNDRAELTSAVGRMDEAVAAAENAASALSALRRRLDGIAMILRGGSIIEEDDEYRQAAERTRDGAIEQLSVLMASSSPGDLPGPSAPEDWFAWAFSLPRKDPDLARVRDLSPKLEAFVRHVGAANWRPPRRAEVEPTADALPARDQALVLEPVPIANAGELAPSPGADEPLAGEVVPDPAALVAFAPEVASPVVEPTPPPVLESVVLKSPPSPPGGDAVAPSLAGHAPFAGPVRAGEGPWSATSHPHASLVTFDAWMGHRHLAEDGGVEIAPWADAATFCATQVEQQRRALVERNLAALWIHASAGELVGGAAKARDHARAGRARL